MNISFTRKVTATVNLDAQEWQLYSSMDGVDKVAEALNRGIETAIGNSSTWGEAHKQFCKVLNAYSEYGAIDTEPRAVADYIISKAFGEEY